jgi:hypothetical protein
MARSRGKAASVYDILYADAKRIGLLLSQFGSEGVLTELTRATNTSSETGGGIDIKIVKGDQKEGEKSELTRRFDPQWLIPLIFLRETQSMLVGDITKARIGQFVLMSGALTILDLSILRLLWDVPFVQSSIAAGAKSEDMTAITALTRHDRRAARARGSAASTKNPALEYVQNILNVVKVMPHGILANLVDKYKREFWCSLREDALIVPSSDLMLKHGTTMSGEWSAVGILDAVPDKEGAANPSYS